MAAAATGPCPGLGDGFLFPCVAAGTIYNRKKERERMTRPAGWKIKRLKKKRARAVLLWEAFG